jgi:4-amino-4-deoxy-L-arabinose transferase-like glycosyltransferase
MPLRERCLWRDLGVLLAICLVAFVVWPTAHGVTNWQEGIRALVGQEMDARGAWITPTVHGKVYLAKPPMVYWLQLSAARLTGSQVDLLHLRLVVALAATAGVVLTYLAGRRMLCALKPTEGDASACDKAWATHAAFWSAALLATGILYVRSGRIGELDILLVPFVVGGAWAGFEAWRSHLLHHRTNWVAVGLLLVASAGAVLTKGPPGGMVLFFAACCGPLLEQAWRFVRSPGKAPILDLFKAWSRMHPVLVVLVAAGALWGWGAVVGMQIGPEAVRAAADSEAADNLRLFEPKAPLRNLESLSYGLGFGSLCALIGVIWLLRDRPNLPQGAWAIGAWIGLSLIAFSVLGKGVPRYLTPMWPGLAMLGGAWLASAIRDLRWGGVLRVVSYALIWGLAIGQGLWYGIGRELTTPYRSPRALVQEVLSIEGVHADDLVGIDLWHPAVDVYAGQFVEPYNLCGPETSFTIGSSGSLEELRARAQDRPVIALIREAQPPVQAHLEAPIRLLEQSGFVVEPIETESRFLVDSLRSSMRAVRVRTISVE